MLKCVLLLLFLGTFCPEVTSLDLTVTDDAVYVQNTTSLEDLNKMLTDIRIKKQELMQNTTSLQMTIQNLEHSVQALQMSVTNIPTPAPTTPSPTGTTKGTRPEVAEAFEARLSHDVPGLTQGTYVPFDEIITNTNAVYDSQSGSFHCRQRGVYLFAITLYSDQPCSLDMYLNNIVIAKPYTGKGRELLGSSETAVVTAWAGYEMRVKFGSETCTIHKNSRISGILIQKI